MPTAETPRRRRARSSPVLRTLRRLMSDRGIYTFRQLEALSGVTNERITLVAQGWRGTDTVREKLATALGVKPEDIVAAARMAHEEAS